MPGFHVLCYLITTLKKKKIGDANSEVLTGRGCEVVDMGTRALCVAHNKCLLDHTRNEVKGHIVVLFYSLI